MIPASYLFRTIYRQHWEEPDSPIIVEQRHRPIDGLMRPLAQAASALVGHTIRRHGRPVGSRAYE